jgi:hypothetical protein
MDLLTNVLILSVKRGSDRYVLFVLSYIGSSTVILYPGAKKLVPLIYRGSCGGTGAVANISII